MVRSMSMWSEPPRYGTLANLPGPCRAVMSCRGGATVTRTAISLASRSVSDPGGLRSQKSRPAFPARPSSLPAVASSGGSGVQTVPWSPVRHHRSFATVRDIKRRRLYRQFLRLATQRRNSMRDHVEMGPVFGDFLLSVQRRVGVVQRELARPWRAAGIWFRTRGHRKHGSPGAGHGAAGCLRGENGVVPAGHRRSGLRGGRGLAACNTNCPGRPGLTAGIMAS